MACPVRIRNGDAVDILLALVKVPRTTIQWRLNSSQCQFCRLCSIPCGLAQKRNDFDMFCCWMFRLLGCSFSAVCTALKTYLSKNAQKSFRHIIFAPICYVFQGKRNFSWILMIFSIFGNFLGVVSHNCPLKMLSGWLVFSKWNKFCAKWLNSSTQFSWYVKYVFRPFHTIVIWQPYNANYDHWKHRTIVF